jgi:hypothetical protein
MLQSRRLQKAVRQRKDRFSNCRYSWFRLGRYWKIQVPSASDMCLHPWIFQEKRAFPAKYGRMRPS